MRRILSCLVLAAALACAAGAEGASLALDPFTKALDPNGCFLTNRPRIVYLGSYCNGAACPRRSASRAARPLASTSKSPSAA